MLQPSVFDPKGIPGSFEPVDKTVASHTAEIEGVELHYLSAGDGPALLLLHRMVPRQ